MVGRWIRRYKHRMRTQTQSPWTVFFETQHQVNEKRMYGGGCACVKEKNQEETAYCQWQKENVSLLRTVIGNGQFLAGFNVTRGYRSPVGCNRGVGNTRVVHVRSTRRQQRGDALYSSRTLKRKRVAGNHRQALQQTFLHQRVGVSQYFEASTAAVEASNRVVEVFLHQMRRELLVGEYGVIGCMIHRIHLIHKDGLTHNE